ncbi:RloB family protein [Acinetobacter sp. P8-3-8]|uniref:RloB family protein n=1 Tax=Acinetobacter sp. P8-3-8 TaxID=1029823 RepID=UPI0002487DCC|nr:RloB family protein [Acinetobacter sp. P8-3-8]
MGSDDIEKKRKLECQKLRESRKQSKRASRNFNEIPRILILTEGLSEKIYFEKIKNILGLQTLEVEKSAYTDSVGIIKEAISISKAEEKIGNEFNYIFCIFDLDTVKNKEYLEVISRYKPKYTRIIPIYSFPCIEIWFILHYEVCTKPFDSTGKKSIGDTAKDYIRNNFEPDYNETNKEIIEIFATSYKQAAHNSSKLAQSQQAVESNNPITTIHQLIYLLERIHKRSSKYIFEKSIEEFIESKI